MEGLYVHGHEYYDSLCEVVDELRPYLWRVAVLEEHVEADRRDGRVVSGWHLYDAGALLRTPNWVMLRLHRNAMQLRVFVEALPRATRVPMLYAIAQNYPSDFQNVVLLSGFLPRARDTASVLVLPNAALENVSAFLGWGRRHPRYAQRGGRFPPAPEPKRFVDHNLPPRRAKRIASVRSRGPGNLSLFRVGDTWIVEGKAFVDRGPGVV